MKTQEYKNLMTEKDAWDDFERILENEGSEDCAKVFREKTGLNCRLLHQERDVGDGDFNGYTWRFSLEEVDVSISWSREEIFQLGMTLMMAINGMTLSAFTRLNLNPMS